MINRILDFVAKKPGVLVGLIVVITLVFVVGLVRIIIVSPQEKLDKMLRTPQREDTVSIAVIGTAHIPQTTDNYARLCMLVEYKTKGFEQQSIVGTQLICY